jgi:hypothetical protein
MTYDDPNADTLLRELLRLAPGSLEIVVADAVCMSREITDLPEVRCKLRDGGEMAWVRSGQIVSVAGPGFQWESIEPNTRALVALP